MRVSIIGQAAFGEAVLKRLIEDGVEIVAASAPEPREGGRPDALWVAAGEAGLAPIDTAALKGGEGLAAWKAAGAELASWPSSPRYCPRKRSPPPITAPSSTTPASSPSIAAPPP